MTGGEYSVCQDAGLHPLRHATSEKGTYDQ
jgi:hypothetical protein